MVGRVSETTLGARHWPALDGLRGVAVLLVVLYHARVPFVRGGHVGVDLFFVLSGFLITTLLLRELDRGRIDLVAFYVRRGLRLLPALVLFVVVCCAVVAFAGPDVYERPTLHGAPFVLAYVANLHQALGWGGGRLGLFDHTWSLAMEEQFYLVWPALLAGLVMVVGRRREHAAALLVGAALGLGVYRLWLAIGGAGWERLAYGPDTRADGLLIGCALALFLASPAARDPRWLPSAALGSAAFLVLVAWRVPADAPFMVWNMGWTLVAVAGGLLTWAAVSHASPRVHAALSPRPLRATGRISYGLYLWHFLVVFGLGAAGAWAWPWWAAAPVQVGLSLAVAWASFVLVERRFLRRKERWAPGMRPKAAGRIAPVAGA
jgi:peptidoglycan/LPS O-acetylase OafA/YrhL